MTETAKRLEFVSFCIESYASAHGILGREAHQLFQQHGIDVFLYENYAALHAQGKEWLLNEIERQLQNTPGQ